MPSPSPRTGMAEPPADLRAQQFAFAGHLRDPGAHPPPPGIEARRLEVYRRLFRNNIGRLLRGNFPVLHRTLGDAAWNALVDDFHARHRCRTPLFTEIGRELLRHLGRRADEAAGDPPWALELAHYEWIELALQIADDPLPPHRAVPAGDTAALLDGVPVLSPFARALAYRWPVHRIGPGFLPAHPPPEPTLVLVRRDAAHRVGFSRLSAPAYRLLELLGGNDDGRDGRTLLRRLATEAGADPRAFEREGAALLDRMLAEGTLLGVRA